MSSNQVITKDIIIKIEKDLLKAMKTSNVEVLDKLLHKDLLFNLPSGQAINLSSTILTHTFH